MHHLALPPVSHQPRVSHQSRVSRQVREAAWQSSTLQFGNVTLKNMAPFFNTFTAAANYTFQVEGLKCGAEQVYCCSCGDDVLRKCTAAARVATSCCASVLLLLVWRRRDAHVYCCCSCGDDVLLKFTALLCNGTAAAAAAAAVQVCRCAAAARVMTECCASVPLLV